MNESETNDYSIRIADGGTALAFDRFCCFFFFVVVALCRSALFEMGNTRVIAAVYGPREVIPLILFVYLGVHV